MSGAFVSFIADPRNQTKDVCSFFSFGQIASDIPYHILPRSVGDDAPNGINQFSHSLWCEGKYSITAHQLAQVWLRLPRHPAHCQ
jgi:hypothetical protein